MDGRNFSRKEQINSANERWSINQNFEKEHPPPDYDDDHYAPEPPPPPPPPPPMAHQISAPHPITSAPIMQKRQATPPNQYPANPSAHYGRYAAAQPQEQYGEKPLMRQPSHSGPELGKHQQILYPQQPQRQYGQYQPQWQNQYSLGQLPPPQHNQYGYSHNFPPHQNQHGYGQHQHVPPHQNQYGYPPPVSSQQYSPYPPPAQNQFAENIVLTQPFSTSKVGSSAIIRQPSTYGGQTSVPYGLEHLAALDQVFVKQRKELLEVFSGCETNNKYRILDIYGQEVFYAKEDTDCCTRQFCGNIRPFDMKLTNGNQEEIIHLWRPLASGSCCCPCCLQSLKVESPPGNPIGSLDQIWTLWIPKYYVKDASGQKVFYIEGPCWTASCCCNDVEFVIYTADKAMEVGKISKKWSGILKEYFTDAENFGITFPRELDPRLKATLIGACMLIDFMFFEHSED